MKAFSQYVIVATKCIEMRGPAQFQSTVGLKLLMQLRRIMVGYSGNVSLYDLHLLIFKYLRSLRLTSFRSLSPVSCRNGPGGLKIFESMHLSRSIVSWDLTKFWLASVPNLNIKVLRIPN